MKDIIFFINHLNQLEKNKSNLACFDFYLIEMLEIGSEDILESINKWKMTFHDLLIPLYWWKLIRFERMLRTTKLVIELLMD